MWTTSVIHTQEYLQLSRIEGMYIREFEIQWCAKEGWRLKLVRSKDISPTTQAISAEKKLPLNKKESGRNSTDIERTGARW